MSEDLQKVIALAQEAGKIHLKYFGTGLSVKHKIDQFDPVTIADKEADKFLRTRIAQAFPDDEILSEENDARPSNYTGRVWMVDPLDGTKDFIAGRVNYSVIIGLLEYGKPTMGVVYAPSTHELFYATAGNGAFSIKNDITNQLHVTGKRKLSTARMVVRNMVYGDNRPLDDWLDSLRVAKRIPEGSIGLKLARIAEGIADIYINSNQRASKWDTLGPQVIMAEAGGVIADINGVALDYAKLTVNWDNYFVAAGSEDLLQEVIANYKHYAG